MMRSEIWKTDDRVCTMHRPWERGTVKDPRGDRNASQTKYVWVVWDDGHPSGFIDPDTLTVPRY
jgi:hypothetical protein